MIVTIHSLRAIMRMAAVACVASGVSHSMAQSALPADIANSIRKTFADDELRYFDSSVDLNGDGKPEVLVYVVGPTVCGTGGCNLLVFTSEGTGYRLVSNISVTQPPIRASSNRSSGWRDLVVRVGGGGGKSGDVTLAFDGKSYPGNPTVPGPRVKRATATGSQMLINEYKSMADGKVLAAGSAPVSAAASAGSGPSFDCAKAATAVEKRVCGDTSLAALDRAVANAYAKGMSPKSEWADSDKTSERANQRAWIAERNACAKQKDVKDCATSAYQRRLAVLQIRNGDLMAPTPVEYRCKGLEDKPVTAAFYEKTEPPSAVLTVGNRQVVAFETQAGSGTKYTTKNAEFWEHHGEAMMKWFGKTYSCKAT
ncbi:hypothetical protein D3870_07875 [Noviherbaspirillum cavernae]|uniref:C-type lysozyme inhibitor domain-containing protein n=1 Tax=Noviherbaspirillum cavernae TaxID=2320862 RepID=A0A418X0C9_9BURK|nr:MliC family protein [Noviherbaspirillum cavernae]RJG05947.1 hypothetical protein D3870_07875 [Noviherbaspirillum cavernae]